MYILVHSSVNLADANIAQRQERRKVANMSDVPPHPFRKTKL